MSTVPQPGADLAFYLVDSDPLLKDVMPDFDSKQWSATENSTTEQKRWADMDNAVGRKEKEVVVAATLDLPPAAVTVRAS